MTRMLPRILIAGALMAASTFSSAHAGWYSGCNTCNPVPVVTYYQPQPCYTTVPVTEMQEVRQVVQKPVVETNYVDQKVTTYEPVVENRTQDIPTVTYQNVTEHRQVNCDYGRWTAQYQYVHKPTACEYDNRPDIFGALNRLGYSITSAFTPNYRVQHTYVPNVQTVNVPYTRQVAVRGTRKVNYQVTKYVPRTTTKKVAVNTVKYVSQEIVTKRPVTVYRTVPIGGTVTTYAPSSSTQSADAQNRRTEKQATKPEELGEPQKIRKRGASTSPEEDMLDHEISIHASKPKTVPVPRMAAKPVAKKQDDRLAGFRSVASTRSVVPETTVERVGRWVARKAVKKPAPAKPQGPAFPANALAMIGK